MSIQKRWSELKDLKELPDSFGVYEIADPWRRTLYIGSGRIEERIKRHKRDKDQCFRKGKYLRFEKIGSESKCRARKRRLLREYEAKHGTLPKYNKRIG